MHIVFARKYRPQTFDEIKGQLHITQTLQNAIIQNRISSSYLFSGPRGIGKTTTARILAKALNCQKGATVKICNKCQPCIEIQNGNSLDVIEIDAASNTQVEKVRETIINTVSFVPIRDRYKVFIIDEAHMLSNSAFNALLKTLEEPPHHVVFILATTEPQKIPLTIHSRCQHFRFHPVSESIIISSLEEIVENEKIKIDQKALIRIANFASGSLRDALSILEQLYAFSPQKIDEDTISRLLGLTPENLIFETAEIIYAKEKNRIVDISNKISEGGYDWTQFLKDLRLKFHKILTKEESNFNIDEPVLIKIIDTISNGIENLRYTDQQKLILEITLFKVMDLIKKENNPADLNWEKLLEVISQKKPILHSLLLQTKLAQFKKLNNEYVLKLAVKDNFSLENIKKNEKSIIEVLYNLLGNVENQIKITYEIIPHIANEDNHNDLSESRQPKNKPTDISSHLEMVLKVFPGSVKKINETAE